MIIIDQLRSMERPKKVSSKTIGNSKKFTIAHHDVTPVEVQKNESISNSNMIFLQELDLAKGDREMLEQFSNMAFHKLRNLQLELLNGEVSERCIRNLEDVLEQQKAAHSSEVAGLIEEIRVRVAVELAKIQMYQAQLSYVHAYNMTDQRSYIVALGEDRGKKSGVNPENPEEASSDEEE